MYLKSLEIGGFKSFGKKAVLEFISPITSIVGPNGSGKSNVAEAFRFVLGEQSIKSLRGKKGEDLIYNGSGESGRLNRASVKVVFDNTKRLLPIDFDEVILERVVHRDSVNEYFINGSQVRLKDIAEVLASANIGSTGHHIISQGEADRILNANLKERRSMIEDALGLKIFQYKKIESQKKLEKTAENIEKVQSLRRELAPHIRFLKKQVEKIEKSRQLREELKLVYKEYLKREDLYISFQREELQKAGTQPKEELVRLNAELAELKQKLAGSKTENAKSIELIDIEEKIRSVSQERNELSHKIGRLEGEISSLERMAEREKRLHLEEGNKMVQIREVEELIARVEIDIEEVEHSGDIEKHKTIFTKIRTVFQEFIARNKNQAGVKVSSDYSSDIAKLEEEKKIIATQVDTIRMSEDKLRADYINLKKSIEAERVGDMEAEKNMFHIMARQNELQGMLNVVRAKEEKLNLEEEDFKREIVEAGILIGREVTDFANFSVVDTQGNTLSAETIVGEVRTTQMERRRTIEKIKIRIEEMGGGSVDEILKEHTEAEERDNFLLKEIDDLEKSAISLRELIVDLEQKIDVQFKEGITKINIAFQKYFILLFGGGTANLKVVRDERRKKKDTDIELDPDAMPQEEEGEEGIDITVDLPKKKVKALMMLSGGERALTSIALLFAISQVNPPPFIILDETDAALDEANSRKYGDMIANLAEYSQLIVITHNRETMSRAGILYGVTMMGGCSKLLSIKFEEAVAVAK